MTTPTLADMATEYFEGEWIVPSDPNGPEPWAVVTYTEEPSPETGHVGWMWWALGDMGEAESYEQACQAAVASLDRRLEKEGT